VRAATRVAIGWGGVLQTRRRRLARARDAVLFAIDPTPLGALLRRGARARPPLRRGALLRPRRPGTGSLFPQPGRLDDALGPGWAVVGSLGREERAAWERLGARVLDGSVDPVVAAWLRDHHAAWAAIRPDRVVFGTGPAGTAGRAAGAAAAWLGANRLHQGRSIGGA